MKAQTSFLSKPVMLVMTIAVLIILLQTVWTNPVREKEQELTIQLMTRASDILDILLSSEECLAMRTQETESVYAYVVSKEKLDEFSQLYRNKEPECARNFEYGYMVVVEEYCPEEATECLSWQFGSSHSSPSPDLLGKQTRSLPVGIMHSRKDIRVGKAIITIFDGTLERLSGFLDKSCILGPTGETERTKIIENKQPISISGKEICMGNSCRDLDCYVHDARLTAGSHVIKSIFKDGSLEVST